MKGILVLILFVAGTFFLAIPSTQSITAQNSTGNTSNLTGHIQAISPIPMQSNNIVNTEAAYDIIFKTASAGAIKTIEMTFPARTNIQNATIVEVSGIGRGTSSINAQAMTYTVTNAMNVPINTFLRFEIWNIVNSPTPNPNLAIQVTTKNSVGGVIDSGNSVSYSLKQITRGDIAPNAVTASEIRDGSVQLVITQRNGSATFINPGFRVTATASCLTDEKVSGGGYKWFGPQHPDSLFILTSNASDTKTWQMTARSDAGGGGFLTVYAMCLKILS